MSGNTSLKDESSVAVAQKVLSAISLSVRDPEQRLSPTASLKPKMLGTVEAANMVKSKQVKGSSASVEVDGVPMNWQGRYKPLGKSTTALMTLKAFNNLKTETSDKHMGKLLSMVPNTAKSVSNTALNITASQQEHSAMQSLFGEEITPQHILLFDILKRVVVKWRSQAAQRKNIIAAEHFAANEVQKKAILKHKEQAMITLPMPIIWAIKEEALAVLQDVAKVYQNEFGHAHKLTVDAKRRLDKLQTDLLKP